MSGTEIMEAKAVCHLPWGGSAISFRSAHSPRAFGNHWHPTTSMMAPQFTNYGPPSVRALKERSRPETRATEVLIQIRAAARHALSPAAKGKP